MAFELITTRAGGAKDDEGVRVEPASANGKVEKKTPAQRGTLKPADMNPPWRGQPQRGA
jgi:hypothetical protein